MNRRQRRVLAGLGAILLISIAALIWILVGGPGEGPDIVDEEDHYWVSEDLLTVNGSAVVNDSGYLEDDTNIQINRGPYLTDLSLFGTYEGVLFYFGQYPEEAIEPEMELGSSIQRGDDVLEGYMVAELAGPEESPELHVDIYYDDALRQAMGDPSLVMWNQDRGTIGRYNYTEETIEENFYHVTFTTNQTERFRFDGGVSEANIMFGDVSIDQGQPVTGQFMMGLQ